MKLSDKTLSLLKNFNSINQSLVVKAGNQLKTMSGGKNIIGKADVDETFPVDFAIFELSRFLGVLSLFKDYDIEFYDDHLKIAQDKSVVRYAYAEPSNIVTAPDKTLVLPSREITFDLPEKDLQSILKAASVLGVPEMAVVGEDGTIYVKAINSKKGDDQFSIAVGVAEASFNMIFKAEYLKVLSADYRVTISAQGLAEFTTPGLTYWVATEQSSKYGV